SRSRPASSRCTEPRPFGCSHTTPRLTSTSSHAVVARSPSIPPLEASPETAVEPPMASLMAWDHGGSARGTSEDQQADRTGVRARQGVLREAARWHLDADVRLAARLEHPHE